MALSLRSLVGLLCLLASCSRVVLPHLPPPASQTPAAVSVPPPLATLTIPPPSPTLSADDLIAILYASDPALPQYDPESTPYAEFPQVLQRLSMPGPDSAYPASHIAHAIAFPRLDSILAAQTLLTLGPEIIATTLDILIDNLHSQKVDTRLYSILLIGAVGERASCAVGDIGPHLWDADPYVRYAAASAIQSILGIDLLPGTGLAPPDLLSAHYFIADIPEGTFVEKARIWWLTEGSWVSWHPSYCICDP